MFGGITTDYRAEGMTPVTARASASIYRPARLAVANVPELRRPPRPRPRPLGEVLFRGVRACPDRARRAGPGPAEVTAWALLLRDPRSGQRIELNYYPPGDPYAAPYTPGEALDHLAFRVDDLPETLARLAALGHPAERMAHYDGPFQVTPHYRMAYVRDPDGIQIELFDRPGDGAYAPDEY